MLATLAKNPVLALSVEESQALAAGIVNVARHYDAGGMSQRAVDWVNLIMVAGSVYGSRIITIRAQRHGNTGNSAEQENQRPLASNGTGAPLTMVH